MLAAANLTVPVRRLRIVSPGGREVATTLARPDVVVPREVFDARLVDAAVRRGAVLQRRTVRRLERRPDGVVLDGDKPLIELNLGGDVMTKVALLQRQNAGDIGR